MRNEPADLQEGGLARDPSPTDYAVPLTAAQWSPLEAISAEGVFDWSKSGVEKQDLAGTWISFGGNEPADSPRIIGGPGRRRCRPGLLASRY